MATILLLHGAIGSEAQLFPLRDKLSMTHRVLSMNFSGHGGKEITHPFSIKYFAEEVVAFLHQQQIDRVTIFGYSMGGYVGLYLARHFPLIVERVITFATKFEWTPEIAAKEVKLLQAEVIEQKLPKFAALLQQRHLPQDWKRILQYTAAMMQEMGQENPLTTEDLEMISCPVLLMIGDSDKMVSIEETLAVYRKLPNAQLTVLPKTQHPIEQVFIGDIIYFISR